MKFKIVLTGAPSSGKSTTLDALKTIYKDHPSYHFVDELAAKYIIAEKNANHDPFQDIPKLEETLLAQQIAAEDAEEKEENTSIIDRSLLDDIAITQLLIKDILEKEIKKNLDDVPIKELIKNLDDVPSKELIKKLDVTLSKMESELKKRNYNLVFILDRLPLVNNIYRSEDEYKAQQQDEKLREIYNKYASELGYTIITVRARTSDAPDAPLLSITARADFIISEIKKYQQNALALSTSRQNAGIGFFDAAQSRQAPVDHSSLSPSTQNRINL